MLITGDVRAAPKVIVGVFLHLSKLESVILLCCSILQSVLALLPCCIL